jgi:nucleoside-diphosphate-sugar epimerase
MKRVADPRKAMQHGWASTISLEEGIKRAVHASNKTAVSV